MTNPPTSSQLRRPVEDDQRPDGRTDLTAGRTVIDVLDDEHRRLAVLSAALTDPASAPHRLASVLTAVTSRHISAEEQYLYPILHDRVPGADEAVRVELAAHAALRRTLAGLESTPAADPAFAPLAHEVVARLRRHAWVADVRLHPKLRASVDDQTLVRLGSRIETAEQVAPSRPHNRLPHRPPWNKMIDPLIGLADKIRDALSRRITYPDDL